MILALMCPAASVVAKDNPVPFEDWLSEIRTEAKERGYSASTLAALDELTRDKRVIGLDRRQTEFTKSCD